MITCFQQLAQALTYGPAVLATVVSVRGSVPREVGARLVVDAQGQAFNTIGGGAGEAKVLAQAQVVLQTGEPQRVDIDLTGAPNRTTQGVCGGFMQVWLERWQGEEALALATTLVQRLQAGQAVTLVTPLDGNAAPYLSETPVNLDPAAAFVDTLQPPPLLLIVGAGHVGVQLAKVAYLAGFAIAVQDDRPDWANERLYPQALYRLAQPIEPALATLAKHQNLYAALVTRGYTYDLEALTQLVRRPIPCTYIGMIGSEKRVRQVYQTLEQSGLPRASFANIYGPIGLDIEALTPEEIAVSITAELIMVRRGGTGRPLSERIRQQITSASPSHIP
ncbi:XdhC/CoxI family protein [Phormidium sp. FACHB-1136]|uniref:XdhC family protein n=1 Tax=Phormidium sp. FACHB-1136 TaxID=2692848 RepID=UPI001688590A|nr:XdhC/CoxI family protein [Phormidium sp. FACHB-1136]MBD2424393.1 XdhC family protein [Phormidium sp. FACHB-1136]